jgi:thiol-disulfide isomerase/thioredoxin
MLRKILLSMSVLVLFITQSYAEPTLHSISGEQIPLSSLSGKWVYLNYWASWCQPCLEEIPELNRFYDQHKNDKNFAMFAVNYDSLPIAQQEILLQQLGIRYPALKYDPRSLLKLGHIQGVPVTFVFNPQGELSETLYGSQTAKSLSQVISAS